MKGVDGTFVVRCILLESDQTIVRIETNVPRRSDQTPDFIHYYEDVKKKKKGFEGFYAKDHFTCPIQLVLSSRRKRERAEGGELEACLQMDYIMAERVALDTEKTDCLDSFSRIITHAS